MHCLSDVLEHTLLITFFVFSMMTLLDYLSLCLERDLKIKKSTQYLTGSFLGIIPGCLGSFFSVSLYLRGLISFGAICATMIATSGDEAFVMLAMFPRQALLLFVILFILGIFGGWLTDKLPFLNNQTIKKCQHSNLHKEDLGNEKFNLKKIIQQWQNLSFIRFFLSLTVFILVFLVALDKLGHEGKYILLLLSIFTGFIVATVPEHYLNVHIWEHIFKKHIWKIFLWTFFALVFTHLAVEHFHLEIFIQNNLGKVFLLAIILGLIPESGPQLIFVTLFAQGAIPFSILLTNSIVQDGHGLLPLLSSSLKDAIKIKIINAIFALMVGGLFLLAGF